MRNSIHLIGHLGKDPEIKALSDDRKRARVSIATRDSHKNQKGEWVEETQWHNVVFWGKEADIAEKYLKKGHEIAIEGRLVHRVYETQAGEKRYITEITVNELVMLDSSWAREAVV